MLMLHVSRFPQRFPFSRTKVRLPGFDFGQKKKADSTHQAFAIANLNQSINQSINRDESLSSDYLQCRQKL